MKKTIRRALAAALAALMLLCFVGCNGDDQGEQTDPTGGAVEQGTEEELTAVREALVKVTETEGFGEITKLELYENGVRTASDKYVQVKDNKKFYYNGTGIKRLVNYTDGYILDMPEDWKPDFSLSSLRCRYENDEVTLVVSEENDAVKRYAADEEAGLTAFEVYLNAQYQFIKNPDYQKANRVSVVEEEKEVDLGDDWKARVFRLKMDGCPQGMKAYYTYVDYYDDVNNSIHMMFKAVDDRSFEDVYMSFKSIYDKGAPVETVTYPCENNPNWNEETAAYYEGLKTQDHVDWGIFVPKIEGTGWTISIPQMQKQLKYDFPVISQYVHFGTEFPSDFAKKVYDDGHMLQISYQYTTNNNTDLSAYSPTLDIVRGEQDAILEKFAQGVADYGHPLFFRLNNEMNTDWTSYCGVANMCDPDLFVESWIRLYDIFTKTGANQYAMWIFNGTAGSFPPMNWANYRCYMPDAKYIDLIGLTAYNGTSMAEQEAGTGMWQTFEQLYDDVCTSPDKNYSGYFADWPWIISEFGCDDEGEARAQWITDMFDTLAAGKYPNIKVAIWFSSNDYDQETGELTNNYNLEGDTESLKAFRDGLADTQP